MSFQGHVMYGYPKLSMTAFANDDLDRSICIVSNVIDP